MRTARAGQQWHGGQATGPRNFLQPAIAHLGLAVTLCWKLATAHIQIMLLPVGMTAAPWMTLLPYAMVLVLAICDVGTCNQAQTERAGQAASLVAVLPCAHGTLLGGLAGAGAW